MLTKFLLIFISIIMFLCSSNWIWLVTSCNQAGCWISKTSGWFDIWNERGSKSSSFLKLMEAFLLLAIIELSTYGVWAKWSPLSIATHLWELIKHLGPGPREARYLSLLLKGHTKLLMFQIPSTTHEALLLGSHSCPSIISCPTHPSVNLHGSCCTPSALG